MFRAVAITVGKYSKICPGESAFLATNGQLSESLNRTLIMVSLLGTLLMSSAGCGRMTRGKSLGRGGAVGAAAGGTESNERVVAG